MEAKTKLKHWLCKLLGCDVPSADLKPSPDPQPKVHTNGNLETFHYDGYDIEVVFSNRQALQVRGYLKGNCVFVGYCRAGGSIEWREGGLHYPSYKTRKYMQEYAHKRLT